MKYGEPWSIEDRIIYGEHNYIVRDSATNGAHIGLANKRRIVATINACAGLDLPDDVPVGALAELVAACKPFAAIAPAFAAMGNEAQRRDDTEVYRAHWEPANPIGKAVTNGDFRAIATALAKLGVQS